MLLLRSPLRGCTPGLPEVELLAIPVIDSTKLAGSTAGSYGHPPDRVAGVLPRLQLLAAGRQASRSAGLASHLQAETAAALERKALHGS